MRDVPLLNASGCLDALAAPDVARSLDAFLRGGTHGFATSPLLGVTTSREGASAPAGPGPPPPPDAGGPQKESKPARSRSSCEAQTP